MERDLLSTSAAVSATATNMEKPPHTTGSDVINVKFSRSPSISNVPEFVVRGSSSTNNGIKSGSSVTTSDVKLKNKKSFVIAASPSENLGHVVQGTDGQSHVVWTAVSDSRLVNVPADVGRAGQWKIKLFLYSG